MTTRYDKLPEHMQEVARLYIEEGEEPGGFLMAVLTNNLVEAATRADGVNQQRLFEWAGWLYNDIPDRAWGSAEKVLAWSNEQKALRLAARIEQGTPS